MQKQGYLYPSLHCHLTKVIGVLHVNKKVLFSIKRNVWQVVRKIVTGEGSQWNMVYNWITTLITLIEPTERKEFLRGSAVKGLQQLDINCRTSLYLTNRTFVWFWYWSVPPKGSKLMSAEALDLRLKWHFSTASLSQYRKWEDSGLLPFHKTHIRLSKSLPTLSVALLGVAM